MKACIRKILKKTAAGLGAAALLFTCAGAEGNAPGEVYMNERISRNYTKVSAGYTFPAYAGEDVPVPVSEAQVDGAEWTTETEVHGGNGLREADISQNIVEADDGQVLRDLVAGAFQQGDGIPGLHVAEVEES